MEVNHPADHDISPESDEGRNLLNAVADEVTDLGFPELVEEPFTERDVEQIHVRSVARLMFLCEMYGNMYEIASYGVDKMILNCQPTRLLTMENMRRF
jgi:hypothetical protein